MTAPLLATRDTLVRTLCGEHSVWLGDAYGHHSIEVAGVLAEHLADALLASGVVRDASALADDEALVERMWSARSDVAPTDILFREDAAVWLRLLEAAFTTESPSRA